MRRDQAEVRGNHVQLRGLDYRKMKLFQLSVLWRASVSSLEFFKAVALGPHEERLRVMLLADEPGPADNYGVVLTAVIFEGKHLRDVVVEAAATRIDDRRAYRFLFAGFLWFFFVGAEPPSDQWRTMFLREDGSLILLRSREGTEEYIRRLTASWREDVH